MRPVVRQCTLRSLMSKPKKSRSAVKSNEEALRRALGEWLRDTDEVNELLDQFGETPLGDSQRDRARLLDVLQSVEPEVVASLLYSVTRGFALMLEEVVQACDRWRVSIAGELQLPGGRPLGRSSALDTSWAHAADGDFSLTGRGQMAALGDQLLAAVSGLSAERLMRRRSESVLNDVGTALSELPDPTYEALLGMETNVTHITVSTGDVHVLAACTGLLMDMQGVAGQLREGAVDAAIFRATSDVQQKRSDLQRARLENAAPSPATQHLLQQLHEISARLHTIVRARGRARRAARGLGDFVQSEFWASRWRLFEVWVLIRCLQTLEHTGLELELLDVQEDVWNLRYGRATAPIARCCTAGTTLEFFYQLFEQGESGAAMPDIALRDTQGCYVFVVDPKHGRSHQRSSLCDVLDRYAARFHATVTAVVNYTRMSSYSYEVRPAVD